MLGSPPAAQRPVPRPPWPQPPPAHTNGLPGRYARFCGGSGGSSVEQQEQATCFTSPPPRLQPYPHKVEDICGGTTYIESKPRTKSHQQPPACLCKTSGWVSGGGGVGGGKRGRMRGCSRTTPVSFCWSGGGGGGGGSSAAAALTPARRHAPTADSPHTASLPPGSTSGGIPVGIAVARQRVQQQSTPPPPLTVVTCEERSTNQIAGWPLAPPPSPWQYSGGGLEQGLPIQAPPMGLQLARDPIIGPCLLLPTPHGLESMQRTVVWPHGCGGGLPPPLQVMQQPQPLLVDRLVTLATPTTDKRRALDEPLTSVMVPCDFSTKSGLSVTNPAGGLLGHGLGGGGAGGGGTGGGGLALIHNLGPGAGHPAAPHHFPSVFIHPMPQNNSLLLSTQLTAEQSLNTSVVISNHQLSENTAVLGTGPGATAAQVIGAAPPTLLQHTPSLLISHTETTNSFVRSDINTVFPVAHHPPHPEDTIIIKEEIKRDIDEKHNQSDKATSPATDLSLASDLNTQLSSDEDVKEATCVQDASNQTETPTGSDEEAVIGLDKPKIEIKQEYSEIVEKEAREEETVETGAKEIVEENHPEVKEEVEVGNCETGEVEDDKVADSVPDVSGLELLVDGIAQYEAKNESITSDPIQMEPETVKEDEVEEENNDPKDAAMFGGLGLLCELAHQRFIEETQNNSTGNVAQLLDSSDDERKNWEKDGGAEKQNGNGENSEWEMSRKLAELKVLYQKEQKTLAKLNKKGPGRPKKSPTRVPKKVRQPSTSPSSNEPPILEPWCASPSHKNALLSPPTLTPHKRKSSDSLSPTLDSDSSASGKPPPLSPACSSSKKRKVGRPKKRAEKPVQTETIVSKPLRCSKTIVGLLLANQAKQELPKPNKIRPKLKAEAKVKSWYDEDELELSPTKENAILGSLNDTYSPVQSWTYKQKEKQVFESPRKLKPKLCNNKKTPRKPVKVLAPKLKRESIEKPVVDNLQPVKSIPECTLTVKHLDALPCRVLVAMGGLFYAGQLTEVTPPDLYGVTLDKERGHRPHIFCREEILADAILEIRCDNLLLPSGTRLCAYWSQQYRCLYPGTVCTDSSPEDKFISVEFDDGDNGKINRDDIRLLPFNYPIIEYDPNPLLTLGKRKRHNSTNSCDSQIKIIEVADKTTQPELEPVTQAEPIEEPIPEVAPKLESEVVVVPPSQPAPVSVDISNPDNRLNPSPEPTVKLETEGEGEINESSKDDSTFMSTFESEQERRRLKKKRKDKLKHRLLENGDIRKHRHKHKESCKTRHKHKHKHRHRKHKHKHSKPTEPLGLLIENIAVQPVDPPSADEEISLAAPIKPETNKKGGRRKKWRDRQGSVESKSKMAAFLPARQLWGWSGKGLKRGKGQGARGRGKIFYKEIQRGKETIMVGDCAVFLSTGRPDRPYIGRIQSMWEFRGSKMQVKVSWFYHPEEAIGCPDQLPYPGALFESHHYDENDVQTISHKCEVLSLDEYKERLREYPQLLETVYDNNDTYYLAGYYDPTTVNLRLEPGVGEK